MIQVQSEILDTFYNKIAKLAKQCQFEPTEEKSHLIDAIIYGTSYCEGTRKTFTDSQIVNFGPVFKHLQIL